MIYEKIMIEKIMIDTLTSDSVSVKKQNFVMIEGKEYPVGDPWRRGYANSSSGRQQVQEEVPESYCTAIFAVWGNEPTVTDPVN